MKKLILIIIIIIELLIIKIPPYIELNNIAIIEEVTLIKQDNKYHLTLKEIIPTKAEQTIKYKYKTYKSTGTSIKNALNNIKIVASIKMANNLPKYISVLEIGLIAKYLIDPSFISPAIEKQPSIMQ